MITGLAIRAALIGLAVIAGGTARPATNLDGRSIDPLAFSGSRAIVLFFAASDCPVSNRYVPEILRLTKEFESRGVRIWFVYPNPGDNAGVVRAHNAEYALTTANTALDAGQSLVAMAHVSVTPEVAVFVPGGDGPREVYRGRIDDRYLAFGRERPQAMHHDLERALDAILAGQTASQTGGPPVGCSIVTVHP